MSKIVSLCKRRGFVFQSSEIYGGFKSSYDYGPLGVELKRNIANAWWQDHVLSRDDVVGLDASIMMHPQVWKTSGHLSGFSDPLVDCKNCKERFRADKAPTAEPGSEVVYVKGGKKKGQKEKGIVGEGGYVCPQCGSTDLSDERQFNLMFQSNFGAVDPLQKAMDGIDLQDISKADLVSKLRTAIGDASVYLRPETAQAMFVQFLNVTQSMSMKVPFGIAQVGKSFRNEIITEHFIFRSCEFEQMEMEFFCEPGTELEWLDYWKNSRLEWYRSFANAKDKFRLRAHDKDELAHYSNACFDVEYEYPWGWDELEGVASRTDYDLKKHAEATHTKLSYFDPNKQDPDTGKNGWRYTPYVIEPAAGLTRAVLVMLLDAYTEEDMGDGKSRVFLKLNPRIAPYKVACLPLLRKEGHPELAKELAARLRKQNLAVAYDDVGSIGKRYARHDEIGTPYCATIDAQTLEDRTITIRHRDSTEQERIPLDSCGAWVQERIGTNG